MPKLKCVGIGQPNNSFEFSEKQTVYTGLLQSNRASSNIIAGDMECRANTTGSMELKDND